MAAVRVSSACPLLNKAVPSVVVVGGHAAADRVLEGDAARGRLTVGLSPGFAPAEQPAHPVCHFRHPQGVGRWGDGTGVKFAEILGESVKGCPVATGLPEDESSVTVGVWLTVTVASVATGETLAAKLSLPIYWAVRLWLVAVELTARLPT